MMNIGRNSQAVTLPCRVCIFRGNAAINNNPHNMLTRSPKPRPSAYLSYLEYMLWQWTHHHPTQRSHILQQLMVRWPYHLLNRAAYLSPLLFAIMPPPPSLSPIPSTKKEYAFLTPTVNMKGSRSSVRSFVRSFVRQYNSANVPASNRSKSMRTKTNPHKRLDVEKVPQRRVKHRV